jgi:hypothetical protein
MTVTDLNGVGEWSRSRIQARYAAYCKMLEVPLTPLVAQEITQGENSWVYPLLDSVIERIEEGDPASTAIGVDLVEENQFMPFGSIIKSNAARALRHATLSTAQTERLRRRLVHMLIAGIIPHEFREYYKLLRTIGVAGYWPELHAGIPRQNPYAMRFYDALLQNDSEEATRIKQP